MQDTHNYKLSQGNAPMPDNQVGSTTVTNPRMLDVEFQKHILDVNPMQMAFYCVFSGWREVTVESSTELYGKKRAVKHTKFVIDRLNRAVNESGANMLYTEVAGLINPASSTSHMKPIEIFNLWNGHLMTIESNLLDTYYVPTYICDNAKCTFITNNPDLMEEHSTSYFHAKYTEIINPYELNIMKYSNIITFLCTLSIITAKAKEGFTLRELAESFMTSQVIKSGYDPVPQQSPGLIRRILNR